MPAIKREAVCASIRNQLMTDPQKGTILLLNLLKLFADRKDDGEFVREIAELASDLAAVPSDSPYAHSPLFAQPMPIPYLQGDSNIAAVPSFSDFNPGELPHPPAPPKPEPKQKEIATDALSALNQMGEDTTQFTNRQRPNEPKIEGYEEWKPKNTKKSKPNH